MPPIDHRLVRDKRDELDLSNGDLAEILGTKSTYVVNIMCGSRSPSRRLIHRLSRALDLPVDKIVVSQDGERTPQGDPSGPPVQPKNEPVGPPRRQAAEGDRKGPKKATTDTVNAA